MKHQTGKKKSPEISFSSLYSFLLFFTFAMLEFLAGGIFLGSLVYIASFLGSGQATASPAEETIARRTGLNTTLFGKQGRSNTQMYKGTNGDWTHLLDTQARKQRNREESWWDKYQSLINSAPGGWKASDNRKQQIRIYTFGYGTES